VNLIGFECLMGRLVNAVKNSQNSWEISEVINIQKSCLLKKYRCLLWLNLNIKLKKSQRSGGKCLTKMIFFIDSQTSNRHKKNKVML